MADQEPNSGIAVPGEAQSSQANPTEFDQARDQAIKDKARKLGWRPKVEYEGDPADWRPAKEFIERQSFFDKIKGLKDDVYTARRESKQLQKDLAIIKDYVQKMSKVEYDRAIADLQAQKAVAVEQANVAEVQRIDTQIDTIKNNKPSANQMAQNDVPAGPPPEFHAWVDKNKWYEEDTELKAQADELGYGIMARNPGIPVNEVLRQVEAKVKKMYPEKFVSPSKTRGAPAVEGGGGTGTGSTRPSKNRLSKGDLTDDQRKVMGALVQRGVLTEEKYLEDLSKSMGMR